MRIPTFFIALASCAAVLLHSQDPGAGPFGTDGRAVFPRGDATAGRMVFESKQCHLCHTMSGQKFPETDLPTVPQIHLGGANHHGWTRDHFAAAIMNPQHVVSDEYRKTMIILGDKLGAENSPMPDFNGVLTVEDLIALATFLEEETGSGGTRN